MKYLITGLGNPGSEYELTRHNIGFLVLDALATKMGISFRQERYGEIASGRLKNKMVYLLKPNTFMNLSGKAVRYWIQELQIPLEHLLVITDDISLPPARLRLRTKGSAGGHNGLTHIEELLKTQEYARMRFGVGNDFAKGKQVDYVLSSWTAEEAQVYKDGIAKAVSGIESFVLAGAVKTMEEVNRK